MESSPIKNGSRWAAQRPPKYHKINWNWRCPHCGSSNIQGKETIIELIEQLKNQRDAEFRRLCDEAVEKCNQLLKERGESYNKGGVHITDYGDALDDPAKTRFGPIYENTLRIKSEINSGLNPEDKILDLINFARFLYAELKMRAKKGQI